MREPAPRPRRMLQIRRIGNRRAERVSQTPDARRSCVTIMNAAMLARRTVSTVLLAVAALCLGVACNSRDKLDVYMEGLQIEAEAEKGPCRIHTAEGQAMPVLSGDQVQTCLRRTEDAIKLYEEAGAMGMTDDVDYQRVLARAYERKAKLEDMLKNVRAMELDAL
jgi:hypothetical protein